MEQIWKLDTLSSAEAFISKQDGQSLLTLENYIGGQFSENTSENIFISAFNPKTGREYAKVPVSDETAVQSAVDAAKAAFPSWAKLSRRERSHHLRRIASLLQENRELLAVWESIDQGKTLERARVEIDRAVSNFQLVVPICLRFKWMTKYRWLDIFRRTFCTTTIEHVWSMVSPLRTNIVLQ